MIAEQCKLLQDHFEKDPHEAINESHEIILKSTAFGSYDEFVSHYLNNKHNCKCMEDFNQNKIAIHCFDCAKCSNSFICLKCFLKGNHKGHHYIISKSPIFKCDCGDKTRMKCSGFCTSHQELTENDLNPENSIDIESRKILKNVVFKAALSALFNMKNEDTPYIAMISDFIFSFLKLGDDFCYLFIELLTEEIDFEKTMINIFDYNLQFNQFLSKLCKHLIHYTSFIQLFSNMAYKIVSNIFFTISITAQTSEDIVKKFILWYLIIFLCFYEYPIQYCIEEKKLNWIDFYIDICKQNKELLRFVDDNSGKVDYTRDVNSVLSSIIYASYNQPNEQIQIFFDKLFSEVFNCGTNGSIQNNTIIHASFKDDGSKINYEPVHIMKINLFQYIFNCFKFKKHLKFDLLFEQLDKTIDLSPVFLLNTENSCLISKYFNENNIIIEENKFPEYYYESFPNGGSFFYNMPLYDSFVSLFGLENNCRIKISQILLNEKYQKLRIKLGIITLQKILSFVCIDYPLIHKNNQSLVSKISSFNDPNQITLGISRYIPVFQLLIGLQSNDTKEDFQLKEFFEYELARKIGIFDDFSNINNEQQNIEEEILAEQNSKMTFSFLYLSILFVVERILFNFNNKEFLRQQILYAHKSGVQNINSSKDIYDKSILDDELNSSIFDEILKETIDSNYNNWHTICATIPIMKQYVLLLNEFSSKPNELIQIQEFEAEENYFFKDKLFSLSSLTTITSKLDGYDMENDLVNQNDLNIRLKNLLMTPTVLAVVYHTLRTNISNINMNCHLAMNILILISKFTENGNDLEKLNQNKFDGNVIHYESLQELISEFRKVLYNYRIDDQSYASMNFEMNRIDFESFLNLKIIFKDQEEKSILDLLKGYSKIGIDVLKTIGINPDDDKNHEDKKEIDLKCQSNSIKSKKDEILRKFQNDQNNFKFDEIDESSEKCLCSVCDSYKDDEILVYPIYVYKTKLPCVFDKPPELKGVLDSVSISCDDDIYQNDPHFFENVLTDNMEKQIVTIFSNLSTINDALFNSELLDRNIFNLFLPRAYNKVYNEITQRSKKTKEFIKNERIKRDAQRKKDLLNNIPKRYIAGANYILQYSTCPHLLHKECVKSINNYVCPICKTFRNCFLPCLTNLPKLTTSFNIDSLPSNVVNSIKDFIELMKTHIIVSIFQKVDIFIELIKSISGIITTFEVSIRKNHKNIYLDEMKLLTRNLFLTTWYAYRIYGKPKMTNKIPYYMENDMKSSDYDVESRLTIFQIFIKKLIEDDNIEIEQEKESSFVNILESYIPSFELKTNRNAKELLLFLRRAYLSKYFLLGSNGDNIDISEESFKWDDILSFDYLFKKYNIKYDHLSIKSDEIISLKPFKITNLPKEFLQFILPPFNFPIDDISKRTYYKIFDFNLMIDYYDDMEENNPDEDIEKQKLVVFKDEIEATFSCNRLNYPMILLSLTQMSSKLKICHRNFNDISLTDIYLDENNQKDLNSETKKPLFLNQDNLDNVTDYLLSINFFNLLKT